MIVTYARSQTVAVIAKGSTSSDAFLQKHDGVLKLHCITAV
jgi:hypothetical protein